MFNQFSATTVSGQEEAGRLQGAAAAAGAAGEAGFTGAADGV